MTNEGIALAVTVSIIVTVIATLILAYFHKEEAPRAFSVGVIALAMIIINGFWIYQMYYYNSTPEGQAKMTEQKIEFAEKKEAMFSRMR